MLLRFFSELTAVDDKPVPPRLKIDVNQQPGGQNIEGVVIECQALFLSFFLPLHRAYFQNLLTNDVSGGGECTRNGGMVL
jgi:hypothetical protein